MQYKVDFSGTLNIEPVAEIYERKLLALDPVVYLPLPAGPGAVEKNRGSAPDIAAGNSSGVGAIPFVDGTLAPYYAAGAHSQFASGEALWKAWRSRTYTIGMWLQFLGEWDEQEHLALSVYGDGGRDFTRFGTRPTLGDFRVRQRQGGDYHVFDDLRPKETRLWHHFTMTYDGLVGTLFRDGIVVGRQDSVLPEWGAAALDMARTWVGMGWTGGIKHIVRYNYALTGDQVLRELVTLA